MDGRKQKIQELIIGNENIVYILKYEYSGVDRILKKLLASERKYLYLTNYRIIVYENTSSEFSFQDIYFGDVSSIEYNYEYNPLALVSELIGIILGLLITAGGGTIPGLTLVGISILGIRFYRQHRVLEIRGRGGEVIKLRISQENDTEEILWYIHYIRNENKKARDYQKRAKKRIHVP